MKDIPKLILSVAAMIAALSLAWTAYKGAFQITVTQISWFHPFQTAPNLMPY